MVQPANTLFSGILHFHKTAQHKFNKVLLVLFHFNVLLHLQKSINSFIYYSIIKNTPNNYLMLPQNLEFFNHFSEPFKIYTTVIVIQTEILILKKVYNSTHAPTLVSPWANKI